MPTAKSEKRHHPHRPHAIQPAIAQDRRAEADAIGTSDHTAQPRAGMMQMPRHDHR